MRPAALLLTNHGNEPYFLGTQIALECGAERICLPWYYFGGRQPDQLRLMAEEFAGAQAKIFLSRSLGALFRPLLRDQRDGTTFAQYVARLFAPTGNEPGLLWQIEKKFAALLKSGFEAEALSGEKAVFYGHDFGMALNIGLPLRAFVEPLFYVFTARMSRLYREPVCAEDQPWLPALEPLAQYWQQLEAEFAASFVPQIHALTHLHAVEPGVLHTPPLARKAAPTHDLEKEAVLVVASGTRQDFNQLRALLARVPERYQRLAFSDLFAGVQVVSQAVFADPRLAAVLSRGGWGTTWRCLLHGKPVVFVHTTLKTDPEIAHSIATLRATGIGLGVDARSPFPTAEQLAHCEEQIGKIAAASPFGEFATDGIAFVARSISHWL